MAKQRTSTDRSGGFRAASRAVARAVSWHRRKLAVTAAILAVLCGVQAAAPPSAATTPVVITTTEVPGGTVLTEDQLRRVDFPPDHLPDRAVTDPGELLGRTTSSALTAGQVLTERSVLSPGLLPEDGDRVLTPVQIDAGGMAHLLVVGDRVDLVAVIAAEEFSDGSGARVVARKARLASVATEGSDTFAASERRTTALVEVTETEALGLAEVGGVVRVLLR